MPTSPRCAGWLVKHSAVAGCLPKRRVGHTAELALISRVPSVGSSSGKQRASLRSNSTDTASRSGSIAITCILAVPEGGHSRHPWDDFLQNLQLLTDEVTSQQRGDAGGIAARVGQTGDQPQTNWIADAGKHDWDGTGCLPGRLDAGRAEGEDCIDLQLHQFDRKSGKPIDLAVSVAVSTNRFRFSTYPSSLSL